MCHFLAEVPTRRPTVFAALSLLPPDPILGTVAQFGADPASANIDLSIGVFRNKEGATPVPSASGYLANAIVKTAMIAHPTVDLPIAEISAGDSLVKTSAMPRVLPQRTMQ